MANLNLIPICAQLSMFSYKCFSFDNDLSLLKKYEHIEIYLKNTLVRNLFTKNVEYAAQRNDETDTQMLIVDTDNYIFVIFPGTASWHDAATDIKIRKKKMKEFVKNTKNDLKENPIYHFHRGFLTGYRSIKDVMFKYLNDMEKPVIFTGHSLGGAYATIAFLVRLASFPASNNELFTFGAPCVGGPNVKRDLDIHKYCATRIVNGSDMVPRLLDGRFGYEHGGNLLYIDNEGAAHWNPSKWYMFWDRILERPSERLTDHFGKSYLEKNYDITYKIKSG